MALNAKSIYDSEFSVFVPLQNFVPSLTGSVDYANSAAWMLRGALLLGTILFVCDLVPEQSMVAAAVVCH